MARDFEDIWRLDELSDDELSALVREQLSEYDTVDADNILVRTENGVVILSGRVGTEGERRIAEHIVSDVIGIENYENEIVVDPITRGEEPEPIDEHLAAEETASGEQLGKGFDDVAGPEAEHLIEELDARLYGTTDVRSAIERGTAWVPPTGPTPEGVAGAEPDLGRQAEDH